MIGLALMGLLLVIALGYFLYKNRRDQQEVQELLRRSQAEDEEQDKNSIV
jgi:LPXTG-motif cell wall-anchored protein